MCCENCTACDNALGTASRIIADCWPSERDEVARAMDVPTASVRELELLDAR